MPVERSGHDVVIHPPAGPISGTARLPGSKSLTNRYLACAAIANGATQLRGASLGDDVQAMLAGLSALGVHNDVLSDQREIHITGTRGSFHAEEADINVGHAGTAMRFLTGLACLARGRYRLDGSARMRQRPIGELVGALRAAGAQIGYELEEGYPPLTILAAGLDGGEIVFTRPPSSQFISSLLMVAPYARRDVMIRVEGPLVSQPYVEMTLDVMRSMGVEVVAHEGRRFVVPALQQYQAGTFTIEPDASAATYLWAAAALTGGQMRVDGLARDSHQGDAQFVDVLAQMGCAIDKTNDSLTVSAPADRRLRGIHVDLNHMPDTVQTLAALAVFADGPTEVRNVGNLRVKETDRLGALQAELTRIGARVTLFEDGLRIDPPDEVTPARIATYDDHRMAMSMALIGLRAPGIVIADVDCVSKSFPDYFSVLGSLT